MAVRGAMMLSLGEERHRKIQKPGGKADSTGSGAAERTWKSIFCFSVPEEVFLYRCRFIIT